ncbi:hypothetical protein JCM10908_002424 [Rhodotorula pacifica]|uniref:uncharacterized protein n=1 Tax=Rhodotorula pacifica TaxID=1495444 RepID=UPI00316D76D2
MPNHLNRLRGDDTAEAVSHAGSARRDHSQLTGTTIAERHVQLLPAETGEIGLIERELDQIDDKLRSQHLDDADRKALGKARAAKEAHLVQVKGTARELEEKIWAKKAKGAAGRSMGANLNSALRAPDGGRARLREWEKDDNWWKDPRMVRRKEVDDEVENLEGMQRKLAQLVGGEDAVAFDFIGHPDHPKQPLRERVKRTLLGRSEPPVSAPEPLPVRYPSHGILKHSSSSSAAPERQLGRGMGYRARRRYFGQAYL